MAENAQIILNWTPVATATVQKIYRSSTSNSGPWTLVHTINNGTTDTWTDTTVDPTPHKQYYYYIETTCSTGTSDSNVDYDTCSNCDEGMNNQSLFIFKNNITNDSSNLVYFTYKHWGKTYWNNAFNTSLNATTTVGVGQTPLTGFNKYIACHTCGHPVTMALPNPLANPEGGSYSSTLNADYTHASSQLLEDYLPASASGFNTTHEKRNWNFDGSNNSSLAHTVSDGNFWLGKATGPSATTTFTAINPPTNYNIGEMQVNQMRISRKTTAVNQIVTNYSTPLSGFGTGTTPSYILMNYALTNSCIFWLFLVTRNTTFDVYSGGTLEMYGFNINYISSFVYDSTQFTCTSDTTQFGHLPKIYNWPFKLKFFTSSALTY